jgi:membrane protease YdiL (CAAX protease family)
MTQDVPQGLLLLLAVAILPPLEEAVFRGWLTGKRWQLVLLGGLVIAMGGLLISQSTGSKALAIVGLGAGIAMVAAGLWLTKDRSGTPEWFVRQFRWWYWASCLVFAAAHYSNYPALTAAHLPVVLPQLWSGLVFGFVRLRFGILRSMTLHVASNAFVLGAFYVFGIPAA